MIVHSEDVTNRLYAINYNIGVVDKIIKVKSGSITFTFPKLHLIDITKGVFQAVHGGASPIPCVIISLELFVLTNIIYGLLLPIIYCVA